MSKVSVRAALCILLVATALLPPPASPGGHEYALTFAGTFQLTFASGEDLSDELRFVGEGEGMPTGPAGVAGYSRTQNGPDGCAHIVHDEVTIDAARGSLFLVNAGRDCVDLVSAPGHILIRGEGTTEIVGGSGVFTGVTGSGTWNVTAEVTMVGPGHAAGTFGPLSFVGVFG